MSALAAPRFGMPGRIQAPNSRPRTIALVGLGDGGAAVARRLSTEAPPNVEVHVLSKMNRGGDALAAIQAGGGDLQRGLAEADMIFIVACRGDDVGLAHVVAGIARARNHPVTALYLVPEEVEAGDVEDEALRTLREDVQMLVVMSDESYVPAMVAALGS